MTRKKVKLAYITNDSARKATFKKRKKGLMKKVSELSTLCGIDACAIIYSPYDSQPEVWPSPFGAQQVLQEFKMLPEMDQSKKMVNQEGFLRQRIGKAAEHLKRQRKDNREKEMTHVMFQCLVGNMSLHHLNIMDLNDLGWLVEQYLKDINRRKENLAKSSTQSSQATEVESVVTANHLTTNNNNTSPGPVGGGHLEASETRSDFDMNSVVPAPRRQQQQWFVDFMNSNENVGFGGHDMTLPPLPDANQNSIWSSSGFP